MPWKKLLLQDSFASTVKIEVTAELSSMRYFAQPVGNGIVRFPRRNGLSELEIEGYKLRHISSATLAWTKVIPLRDDGGRDTRATAASQISIEL
jgi:hypothetical protein